MAQTDRVARLLIKIVPARFIKSREFADGPAFCQAGVMDISRKQKHLFDG
jgi:hypothetical protein